MSSPALGDVRNIGSNDVVALNYAPGSLTTVLLFDGNNGKTIWKKVLPFKGAKSRRTHPNISDLDEDGKNEVIVGDHVLNGVNGEIKFKLPSPDGHNIVKNVNPSAGKEIIGSKGIYSSKGVTLCSFSPAISLHAVGKIKKEHTYETIVGVRIGTPKGKILGFRSTDCKNIFTTTMPDKSAGPVNMADFDGDGELEFGTAGANYYSAYESDGSKMWSMKTKDYSSAVTGSTTFDLNGDGKYEIIYNDEHYLRVYEGETGEVLFYTKNGSGTSTEYPIVVDVNGDGMANVVVAANNYRFGSHAGIRVFESPGKDWVGARGIWNQHGYYAYNVSGEGSLQNISKVKIWKHHIEEPHLAGFRNNIPVGKRCFLP